MRTYARLLAMLRIDRVLWRKRREFRVLRFRIERSESRAPSRALQVARSESHAPSRTLRAALSESHRVFRAISTYRRAKVCLKL